MSFYGTAVDYLAYMAERNITPPSEVTADIEAALLFTSEWLDGKYARQFPGYKTGQRAQVREWPRTGAYDRYWYAIDDDITPREIEYATYEATLIHMTDATALHVNYTPSKYKSAAVSGAVSVTYANFGSSADVQTSFDKINQILAPLLVSSGGGVSADLSRV